MTDFKENPRKGEMMRRFEEELHANMSMSPARTELERRKLVARIAADTERRSGGHIVPLAVSFAAAAALIAVVLFLSLDFSAPAETVAPLELSGLWRITEGDPVSAGRPVETPEGAKLVLPDGTTLWLAPGTSVAAPGGVSGGLRLERGRLLASVAERAAGSPFTVKTPEGEVVVHGTVFSVSLKDEGMTVRLHRGAVEVKTERESARLSPGHRIDVARGVTTDARPVDRAGVLSDLMIMEHTRDLDGPAAPLLTAPEDRVAPSVDSPVVQPVAERPAPVIEPKRERKRARWRAEDTPLASDTAPARTAPDAGPLVYPPTEDDLFLEAYSEYQKGDHRTGRQLLDEYLQSHPDGRYWSRVKDILGENTTP